MIPHPLDVLELANKVNLHNNLKIFVNHVVIHYHGPIQLEDFVKLHLQHAQLLTEHFIMLMIMMLLVQTNVFWIFMGKILQGNALRHV